MAFNWHGNKVIHIHIQPRFRYIPFLNFSVVPDSRKGDGTGEVRVYKGGNYFHCFGCVLCEQNVGWYHIRPL